MIVGGIYSGMSTSLNSFSSLLTSSPRIEVGNRVLLKNIERKAMWRVVTKSPQNVPPLLFLPRNVQVY